MKNETLLNDPVERAVQKMLKAEKEYINILTVMEEKMFGHLSKMLTSKEQTVIFYGIKVAIQLKMQTLCNSVHTVCQHCVTVFAFVKFLNTLLLTI